MEIIKFELTKRTIIFKGSKIRKEKIIHLKEV